MKSYLNCSDIRGLAEEDYLMITWIFFLFPYLSIKANVEMKFKTYLNCSDIRALTKEEYLKSYLNCSDINFFLISPLKQILK